MRLVKRFCFAVLLFCVVLFAVLNPHAVRLNLLFTPAGFRLPLSLLVTGVFLAGFLLGCGTGLWGGVVRRAKGEATETKETKEGS